MKIAIICVGVITLRFRTVPPHGSSNKTRVNRAMPHHRLIENISGIMNNYEKAEHIRSTVRCDIFYQFALLYSMLNYCII